MSCLLLVLFFFYSVVEDFIRILFFMYIYEFEIKC